MRKIKLLHIKDSDNKLLVDKKMFGSPNASTLKVSSQSSDPRQKFKKQIERDLALVDNLKNINRLGATSPMPLDRSHVAEALIALDMVKENEEYESDDASPGRRRRAENSRQDLLVSNMTDSMLKRGTQRNSPAPANLMTPCESDDVSVSLTSNRMTESKLSGPHDKLTSQQRKLEQTTNSKRSKRTSIKQSSKERRSKSRLDNNVTMDDKPLSLGTSSLPRDNYKSQVLDDVNVLSMPQLQNSQDMLATEQSAGAIGKKIASP